MMTIDEIYEKIAEQHHTSPEKVKAEITEAIRLVWKHSPGADTAACTAPTNEEFLRFLTGLLRTADTERN